MRWTCSKPSATRRREPTFSSFRCYTMAQKRCGLVKTKRGRLGCRKSARPRHPERCTKTAAGRCKRRVARRPRRRPAPHARWPAYFPWHPVAAALGAVATPTSRPPTMAVKPAPPVAPPSALARPPSLGQPPVFAPQPHYSPAMFGGYPMSPMAHHTEVHPPPWNGPPRPSLITPITDQAVWNMVFDESGNIAWSFAREKQLSPDQLKEALESHKMYLFADYVNQDHIQQGRATIGELKDFAIVRRPDGPVVRRANNYQSLSPRDKATVDREIQQMQPVSDAHTVGA